MIIKNFTFLTFYDRIADKTREIMKGILFYQMINCVINVAFDLFSLDQTLNERSTDTVHCIATLFSILLLAFIFCYYADRVTSDLLGIGDSFYNSLWYKSPFREQKLLILLIRRAQKEFRLTGFEIFDCSIEMFVMVCQNYFLLKN